MSGLGRRLSEMSWVEVKRLCGDGGCYLIIPCGSVEQHGHHLPLGTDLRIAVELSMRAAEAAWEKGFRVVVAEPVSVSVSDMWAGNAGTLWVSAESFMGYVKDYVVSAFRTGFKRVIVVNAHGGNSEPLKVALKLAVQELEPGYRAYLINYWEFVGDVMDAAFSTPFFHADEAETSIASALGLKILTEEAAIPSERIRRPYSEEWHSLSLQKRPRVYFFYREGEPLEIGAFGAPQRFSREAGLRVVSTFTERFVKLVGAIEKGEM